MPALSSVAEKISDKLGDHPAANGNPDSNPSMGVRPANNGDNPNKTVTQNWIEKGQGGDRPGDEPKFRAGSLTSTDAASSNHVVSDKFHSGN